MVGDKSKKIKIVSADYHTLLNILIEFLIFIFQILPIVVGLGDNRWLFDPSQDSASRPVGSNGTW